MKINFKKLLQSIAVIGCVGALTSAYAITSQVLVGGGIR
jgi:hypothetical protein